MVQRIIMIQNLQDLGKTMLIPILLGILINPVLNQHYMNCFVQLHKIALQNHNLLVNQKIIVLLLPQELSAFFKISSNSEYISNRKSGRDYNAVAKAKKLLHKTFRIPEDVVDALEEEARSRDIPLSILVNGILKNYLWTEIHPEKSGFILTSKDFFRRMFSRIDEKSLEEYGTELGNAMADEYTYLYFPQIDSHTIVQFLESWFKRFQSYRHRFDEENKRHTFSLNHDINMNFSIVLKVILQGLIEPVTKSQVIFGEIRSSSISFSFEV